MTCEVTSEDLAALTAGDLDQARAAQVRAYAETCPHCRRRLTALAAADAALAAVRPLEVPAGALLETRRVLSESVRGAGLAEIMTLEEVAAFLRIKPVELGEVIEELPAFELAGQVRVRRARLIEWVEQRERDFRRQKNESWVARSNVLGIGKGVA